MIYLILRPALNTLSGFDLQYYCTFATDLETVFKLTSKDPSARIFKLDGKEIHVDASFQENPV